MDVNIKESYVVGLMSGTSLDGVDAALVKIIESDGKNKKFQTQLIHFITIDYPAYIQTELLKLCDPESARLDVISKMNMYLGEIFADAVFKVISESSVSTSDVGLISSHGQTIYHQPNPKLIDEKQITSTFQIGDINVISERTGITTVGDFRTRDMAAGGQGAPMVPYFDFKLFRSTHMKRVLLNIGGIANLTYLPKSACDYNVFAYDTGPGNMIIDAFAKWITDYNQPVDWNGQLARQGEINEKWLSHLLDHEYYNFSPPKTTGRELFGERHAAKLWEDAERIGVSKLDRIATITELTALTITNEIKKMNEGADNLEVLSSGGGVNNNFLMERLRGHLPTINVKKIDDEEITADSKEAIAFALLGYQCYHNRTNNLPNVTGASNASVMGKLALAKNNKKK